MRFRFAPPHGTRYRCTTESRPECGDAVDQARIVEESLVHQTESGYRIITTPVSVFGHAQRRAAGRRPDEDHGKDDPGE
jgi:hypothetical protein